MAFGAHNFFFSLFFLYHIDIFLVRLCSFFTGCWCGTVFLFYSSFCSIFSLVRFMSTPCNRIGELAILMPEGFRLCTVFSSPTTRRGGIPVRNETRWRTTYSATATVCEYTINIQCLKWSMSQVWYLWLLWIYGIYINMSTEPMFVVFLIRAKVHYRHQ